MSCRRAASRAAGPGARRRLYYAMLLRRLVVSAAALLLALAGSTTATAQGVSLSHAGSGARAAGMADAFVAVSDDGTAASWNPAGLAQLRQPEFSFVYAVSERGQDLTGLRSADDQIAYVIRDPFRTVASSVDFASAALPFSIARKPITLQVSWHRLYQLTNAFGGEVESYLTVDPTSPAGFSYIEDRLRGSIDVISVAGAVKLTRSTSIGGSVDFWRGGWNNQTLLVENADSSGNTAFVSLDATAKTRGTTGSIGLLLTYPAWNVGLVYHAPFWSTLTQTVNVRATVAPPASATLHGRFRLPRSIAGGVAWRPAARWTAAVAVTQDQWTDALVEGEGVLGTVNFFDELPPALSSTRDTVALNIGVEHLFVRDAAIVPLRLGLGWEPQGQMDTVVRDPIDYLLFSAGTGYNTNRFKFDAAVQLRRASARQTVNFTVVRRDVGRVRSRRLRPRRQPRMAPEVLGHLPPAGHLEAEGRPAQDLRLRQGLTDPGARETPRDRRGGARSRGAARPGRGRERPSAPRRGYSRATARSRAPAVHFGRQGLLPPVHAFQEVGQTRDGGPEVVAGGDVLPREASDGLAQRTIGEKAGEQGLELGRFADARIDRGDTALGELLRRRRARRHQRRPAHAERAHESARHLAVRGKAQGHDHVGGDEVPDEIREAQPPGDDERVPQPDLTSPLAERQSLVHVARDDEKEGRMPGPQAAGDAQGDVEPLRDRGQARRGDDERVLRAGRARVGPPRATAADREAARDGGVDGGRAGRPDAGRPAKRRTG